LAARASFSSGLVWVQLGVLLAGCWAVPVPDPFSGQIEPGSWQKALPALSMLVSALMGLERMKAAHAYAIENGYRFYSYGDASLLLP